MHRIPVEDRVILLLVRRHPPSRAEWRAVIRNGVDWPVLLDVGGRHHVGPLLYHRLAGLGWRGVPQFVRRELMAERRRGRTRGLAMAAELARLLRLLNEAGVPAIPLKGPLLGSRLYGDPGLRPVKDLDILVPSGRLDRAWRLLRKAGCDAWPTDPFLRRQQWGRLQHRSLLIRRLSADLPVELHDALLRRAAWDRAATERAWRRCRQSTAFGAPAFELDRDLHLLYLAAHAGRHRGRRLKWLVDLDRAALLAGADWERLLPQAESLDWEREVHLALHLCADLLGTSVPRSLGTRQLPSSLAELHEPGGVVWTATRTRFLPSLRQRAVYLAEVAIRPTAAELRLVSLPRPLRFFYFALRPFRMAARISAYAASRAAKLLRRLAGRLPSRRRPQLSGSAAPPAPTRGFP